MKSAKRGFAITKKILSNYEEGVDFWRNKKNKDLKEG